MSSGDGQIATGSRISGELKCPLFSDNQPTAQNRSNTATVEMRKLGSYSLALKKKLDKKTQKNPITI